MFKLPHVHVHGIIYKVIDSAIVGLQRSYTNLTKITKYILIAALGIIMIANAHHLWSIGLGGA